LGETCDVGAQCASGVCGTGIGPCGVCAVEVKVSEACGPTALCTGYLAACMDGMCVDRGTPLGGQCNAPKGQSTCQRTLWCPADSATCTPRHAVGEHCDGGLEECVQGALCFQHVCTRIVIAPSWGACSEVAACPRGQFCRDGTCYQPALNVGEGGDCP